VCVIIIIIIHEFQRDTSLQKLQGHCVSHNSQCCCGRWCASPYNRWNSSVFNAWMCVIACQWYQCSWFPSVIGAGDITEAGCCVCDSMRVISVKLCVGWMRHSHWTWPTDTSTPNVPSTCCELARLLMLSSCVLSSRGSVTSHCQNLSQILLSDIHSVFTCACCEVYWWPRMLCLFCWCICPSVWSCSGLTSYLLYLHIFHHGLLFT